MHYFKTMGGSKAKVFLVHGEAQGIEAIKNDLNSFHSGEVTVGILGETVTV